MDTTNAIKKMLGGSQEGKINKMLGKSKESRTHEAVEKIIGDKETKDQKIPGTICRRCGGKRQITLGNNVIACPVCKGRGRY